MPEFLETTVDKFIFRVAADRLYSPAGVWVLESAAAGDVRLGVSDFVQKRNGDAAFVHVKAPGARLAAGDEFAELETVKATVGLILPLAGEIVEVNQDLDSSPESINEDPYGKGWLAVLRAARWGIDRRGLLDPPAYLAVMRAQAIEEMS